METNNFQADVISDSIATLECRERQMESLFDQKKLFPGTIPIL